jgi:hypothetical protein
VSAHVPSPPIWDCSGCGRSWPCATRREQLRAEYDGAHVSLVLFLSGHFVNAARDLPGIDAGTLYNRFFGWLWQFAGGYRRDEPVAGSAVPEYVEGYRLGR